jgi:hypothetical protein
VKRKLFVLVFLTLSLKVFGAASREDARLGSIANEVSGAIRKTPLNRGDSLAIAAINNATESVASNIISSLETAIVKSGYVRLISRKHTAEAVDEIDLGLSGYVDDASAARIGHFLGAAYIMAGAVTSHRQF